MSPAFLVYLRNTIHSSEAHSKSITVKLIDKDKHNASYRPMDKLDHIVNACSQPLTAAA